MPDISQTASVLRTGTFILKTPWDAVVTSYTDEREGSFICQIGDDEVNFKAVVRFTDSPLPGYKGHSTDPSGFKLYFDPGDGGRVPRVVITA